MTKQIKHPHPDRLIIVFLMSIVTLMEVLDGTIVNVALPAIQGALHTTSDKVTWVATAYIVASGVFMPTTGYFCGLFGRKNYLTGCIIGFTIVSMLCGMATSLPELIVFRLIQGAFGACLIPLSQAILIDIHPSEERGKAMAIWGLGVMVGPVLGPTLGGYITEYLNWRWVFYVNLPFGLISILLSYVFVPDSPIEKQYMDWPSLILLFTSVGCFQYFLDRGQSVNWFDAISIRITFVISILSTIGFIYYGLKKKNTIFSLEIFKDKNFTIATLVFTIMGLALYGSTVIHPIFLEIMLGYPAVFAGLAIMPRALAASVSMFAVSRTIGKIDSRFIIFIGVILNVIGLFFAMEKYSSNISLFWIIAPFIIQGLGMGLVFVPLSSIAYITLPTTLLADAAGVFSLFRTIGGSIGISIAITVMVNEGKKVAYHMHKFINPFNQHALHYANALGGNIRDPLVLGVIEHVIAIQSNVIGMLDAYKIMGGSFIFIIPLILFLDSDKNKKKPETLLH